MLRSRGGPFTEPAGCHDLSGVSTPERAPCSTSPWGCANCAHRLATRATASSPHTRTTRSACCRRRTAAGTAAGTAAPPAQDPPAERPAALATAAAPERARALRRPRLLVPVLVLALSVVAVGVVGLRLGVAHLRTAGTAVAPGS